MLHNCLEMKDDILIQSAKQRCIRVHTSVDNQVDCQCHAIQSLDVHYSTVHTTICGIVIVHSITEVLVDSLQCLIV